MKRNPKYKIGDAVVMWSKKGAGIYDGNIEYVRDVDPIRIRYGLSDINEGSWRGWMPQAQLLSIDDFKAMVESGEVGRVWKGSDEKLMRIYKRYK